MNSLSFAFYSHTIDKQQGRQLTNVHKSLFCTETALPLFPRPMKHCWALRMTKAKIRLLQILCFAFYSRQLMKQQHLGTIDK
jgi:hypothetical protein